jgi:hypothetical protein
MLDWLPGLQAGLGPPKNPSHPGDSSIAPPGRTAYPLGFITFSAPLSSYRGWSDTLYWGCTLFPLSGLLFKGSCIRVLRPGRTRTRDPRARIMRGGAREPARAGTHVGGWGFWGTTQGARRADGRPFGASGCPGPGLVAICCGPGGPGRAAGVWEGVWRPCILGAGHAAPRRSAHGRPRPAPPGLNARRRGVHRTPPGPRVGPLGAAPLGGCRARSQALGLDTACGPATLAPGGKPAARRYSP